MKRYYVYNELRRMSYYDLYKVCVDEKLVEGFQENLNREELVQIILKYRSRDKVYGISEYDELGMSRLQDFFDRRLGFKLSDSNLINVPHQLIIYKGVPLTPEDNYKINLPESISDTNVFLINGQDYLCGIFELEPISGEINNYFLKSDENFFRLDNLRNQNYSLFFFNKIDEKHLHEMYYGKNIQGKEIPALNYYQIPLDSFLYQDLETTTTPLCIDFGTANTTAGVYLDRFYINNLPQNKILDGKIKLDSINYVTFPIDRDTYSKIIPTVVYIRDCFDEKNIDYVFGHQVKSLLRENNYSLKGSVFYGIKNWVKSLDVDERIVDENGDIRYIPRGEIIKNYVEYVVARAENIFKCKFKNIHVTTPVKLKKEFLTMFENILPDYKIITKNALDEGVAVLYNSIERIIDKNLYDDNQYAKALIIDCGGGTTDLASCLFKVSREDIFYDIDIKTTFENSEDSFGGNNITYRIMQYLKIILANYYRNIKEEDINKLIPFDSELIYSEVDDSGVDSIYSKLEETYVKAEEFIPTRFKEFENTSSQVYKQVKNNFFFLWEIAEELKKELFRKNTIVRTRFDCFRSNTSDLSVTYVKDWILYVKGYGSLEARNSFPEIIITKDEIVKLVKADIYEVFRRFLTQYYESNKLFDYSLIKLSGQSCKVNLFNEILKEFVPGKMIDFRRNVEEDEQQLKISCLDGTIKYLHSSKMGNIRVDIKNDIPIVPYSLTATKYNGEYVELVRIGGVAGKNCGEIKKISTTEVLSFYLKNKEEELKNTYTFLNKISSYKEMGEDEVLESLEGKYEQDSLDRIANGETNFFVYTDGKFWGFYVVGVKRENERLLMGEKSYFSFEEDITTISFFDGLH